jgi:hypothetical protein
LVLKQEGVAILGQVTNTATKLPGLARRRNADPARLLVCTESPVFFWSGSGHGKCFSHVHRIPCAGTALRAFSELIRQWKNALNQTALSDKTLRRGRAMDKLTDRIDKKAASNEQLAKLISKAMHDLEITASEYQQILDQVNADGHVDAGEQKLLQELQSLIANGTITRVRG